MRFLNIIVATVGLLVTSPAIAADNSLLTEVQNEVHSRIKFLPEQDGKDNWQIPKHGYGDCEDFALLKRQMLIERGWPEQDLKIILVYNRKLGGHAVLLAFKSNIILDSPVYETREQVKPQEGFAWMKEKDMKFVCIFDDISEGDKKQAVVKRCANYHKK